MPCKGKGKGRGYNWGRKSGESGFHADEREQAQQVNVVKNRTGAGKENSHASVTRYSQYLFSLAKDNKNSDHAVSDKE